MQTFWFPIVPLEPVHDANVNNKPKTNKDFFILYIPNY